jgi:diadenosine tetraphosphate (Ap4A) HIT family hydrolase
MLERCRAGDYPAVVSRLRSGWLVMGERQVFPGYCLLLPDPVVAHLNALQPAAQAQFLSDMASSGDAMLASTGATRINYAIFGNVDPALHAHLFPRHSTEPSSSRSLHPWALDWDLAPEYSEAAHGELKRRIAAEIEARELGASGAFPG